MGGRGKTRKSVSSGGGNVGEATVKSPDDWGKEGVYEAWRTGEIADTPPNGVISFGSSKDISERYMGAYGHSETAKPIKYNVKVNNPLVIKANTEPEAVQQASKQLRGVTNLKVVRDYDVSFESAKTNWQNADKQNMGALKKSGYDSIIYVISGRPQELLIPSTKKGDIAKAKKK